jgi:cytochrome c peroxidase
MLSLGCLLLTLCVGESPVVFTPAEQRRILQHSPVPPAPDDPTNAWDHDPRAVRLGQSLFFDARFSSNSQVSCASCHGPMLAFTDGLPLSEGLSRGTRHAPSLLNVAHQRWFFWDGRADTLWSQALHPIENPSEFGTTRNAYLRQLTEAPSYQTAYEQIFGAMPDMGDQERFPIDAGTGSPAWDAMSEKDQHAVNTAIANCGKAIAAYETQLRSSGSPFDIFAEGLREQDAEKTAALSPSAQRGLKLFIGDAGCRQCHSGPLFTDFEFHNIGLPTGHGEPPRDPGRHEGIAKVQTSPFSANGPFSDQPNGRRARRTISTIRNGEHWGAFKTPSLRNLTRTAPYMHQGQLASIEDVLLYYNTLEDMLVQDHHQETVLQPLDLDASQLDDLAAFLRSLESPLPRTSLLGVPRSPLPEPLPPLSPPSEVGEP